MNLQYEENENFVRLTQENGVVLVIPKDEGNSDYQRYLRWLENPDAEEGATL